MSSCHPLDYSENQNKIRKRGCSSSSSSSFARRYRFKRAILISKKGGSTTPVPMWKTRTTSSSPPPPSVAIHPHTMTMPSSRVSCEDNELSVSARKLAATLWEINDSKDLEVEQVRKQKAVLRSREKPVRSSRSALLQSHMSDPSYSPISEMKEVKGERYRRVSGKLQLADYYFGGFDGISNTSFMEVANQPRNKACGKCTGGVKNRLKEARSGLSTSKKILKVLNQMILQEQHSSSIPLIMALGSELDRACNQIDEFIHEQGSNNQNEIDHIMKRFAEEKAAWKRREREKVRDAITHIGEELEVEKKLRRQTERLNKKIAKEMADVKASHLKASRELEREKRAKEILEQICDELAKGIGEDRAQVEELKRESEKVREEVEKEREMLQLADVLREERVQMKLSEAKYQYEEKNAVLEKLRNELESFLRTKEDDEEKGDNILPELKKMKDLEFYLNKTCWGLQTAEEEDDLDVGDGVEQEGDDSADSDLHSIELNMDNDSRSYKWSYAYENEVQRDSNRISMDKESIGRKSFSEKIQWASICFNKGTSGCKKRDFGINIQEVPDEFDQEISSASLPSQAQIQEDKDENETYRTIIGSQGCLSLAQRCSQTLVLPDTGGESEDSSVVLERDDFKQEAAGRKPRVSRVFDS